VASGCQSSSGPLARWRALNDDAIAPPPTAGELGDTRGPLAQILAPEKAKFKRDDGVARVAAAGPAGAVDPEVERDMAAAETLFEDGRFDEAEKLLVKLDRKREKGSFGQIFKGKEMKAEGADSVWVRDSDRNLMGPVNTKRAPWGEKTLWYLAEAQYRQGKLIDANDTLVKLVTAYPGTRYLEQAVKREYEIADTWLAATAPDAPAEKKAKPGDVLARRIPPIDASGHALQVLEHVRHHDPLGPLADDAVLRLGNHHYDRGEWEEAYAYYDQLIDDHPKSEHVRAAYLRSIEAKVNSYYGPGYDASGLAAARKQIEQFMSLFPDRDAEVTADLSHKIDLIEDQQAEIAYKRGEFYKQTGYPGAAELCFGEVKARWPESEWAKRSTERLAEVAKMPRKAVEPSKIMTTPGSGDGYANGPGNPMGGPGMPGGGMGGMGMPMGGMGR
jgi:outer membrane protein assembly factor BamD (BamD/ComL family)